MNDSLLSIILLGLVTGITPFLFGAEIALLGEKGGLKKGVGFFSGIILFRAFMMFLLGVIFASFLNKVSSLFDNLADWIASTFQQVGLDITSGDYIIFDALLVVAGIALWIQVVQHIRNRKQDKLSKGKPSSKSGSADDKTKNKGVKASFLLGFTWTAVSTNQWIFTTAAVGQILAFSQSSVVRIVIGLVFLLLASLMMALPIIVYLIRPKSAQVDLAKLDKWLGEAMPYFVIGILFIIGLYFILSGTTGMIHFLES